MSITPELLQNPTAFSSNNQLLSVADDAADEVTDEAFEEATEEETTDDELLLELLTTLELDFGVLVADEVAAEEATDEVVAPHRLPLTLAVAAVPLA